MMKRTAILILAASILFGATSVMAQTLPLARRSSGDPDEFQARRVLDNGLPIEGTAIDDGSGGKPPARPEDSRMPGSARRIGVDWRVGFSRFSKTFSGKTILLEK